MGKSKILNCYIFLERLILMIIMVSQQFIYKKSAIFIPEYKLFRTGGLILYMFFLGSLKVLTIVIKTDQLIVCLLCFIKRSLLLATEVSGN